MTPQICVIIPMYGQNRYTKNCVDMTLENAGVPVDILVVDDGSPTPYEDTRVAIHRIDKNSGFTNALNEGILWCGDRYKYIHCLNNDTEPEKDFIKLLYDVMEADPTVGISGSVRVYKSGVVELCGADLIRGHQYLGEAGMSENPIECNWLPICSGLLRHSMVREIGLLDKRFRNHCSDADYCLMAKIRQWKVILVPKSRVLHYLSVTTSHNNISAEKDQNMFMQKLAGMDYAVLMRDIPLDTDQKTYGKLEFSVYKK